MLKLNNLLTCYLRAYVSEFFENIVTTDKRVKYWKMCDIKVSAENKFTVNQDVTHDKTYIININIYNKHNYFKIVIPIYIWMGIYLQKQL